MNRKSEPKSEPENTPCPECGANEIWELTFEELGDDLIEAKWTCPKCGYVIQTEKRRKANPTYIR
jgi:predicted RNA-binding Zn-ribbon protein involved in translation (DUF1610 family)